MAASARLRQRGARSSSAESAKTFARKGGALRTISGKAGARPFRRRPRQASRARCSVRSWRRRPGPGTPETAPAALRKALRSCRRRAPRTEEGATGPSGPTTPPLGPSAPVSAETSGGRAGRTASGQAHRSRRSQACCRWTRQGSEVRFPSPWPASPGRRPRTGKEPESPPERRRGTGRKVQS